MMPELTLPNGYYRDEKYVDVLRPLTSLSFRVSTKRLIGPRGRHRGRSFFEMLSYG